MEHINSDPLDSQHKVILVVEDDEAVGDFMQTSVTGKRWSAKGKTDWDLVGG